MKASELFNQADSQRIPQAFELLETQIEELTTRITNLEATIIDIVDILDYVSYGK